MNLLPHSSDAEAGLLSSFLILPRDVGRLCADRSLGKSHFHIPKHATIYGHLLQMWAEESPVDFILLTTRLRDHNELESVGGPGFVTSLFTLLPTAVLAAEYAAILEEKKILRQIITTCHEYSERSRTEQHDFPNVLSELQSKIAGIGCKSEIKIPTMRENILNAIETLEGRALNGENVILTGLQAFDVDIGPMERGNLVVIGGQTKAGKSILAAQLALNIALNGHKALYISLEMSERELTLRLLSSLGRINTRAARQWNDFDHNRMREAQKTLEGAPFITVTRRGTISEVSAVCQQLAALGPLGVIVLDYAQLCIGTPKREDRRYLEIGEISRTCKRLAVSLNCLFILLTQLNDDGRTRESRDIENDANLMVEVGHNKETGERGVKVVLARSAPSGQRLKLRVIAEHTRVEDAPEMDVEPEETKPKRQKRNWHQ